MKTQQSQAPRRLYRDGNVLIKNILTLALVLAACVYGLLFISYGLDFTDSFYFINRFIHAQTVPAYSPLDFLSIKLGAIAGSVFGTDVISFRLMDWCLFTGTTYSAVFILERRQRREFLIFAAVISIIIAPLNSNVLSYSTFTYLFVILTQVCLIKYVIDSNLIYLALSGTFTGVAVGCRFPNVLIILTVPVLLFILGRGQHKHSLKGVTSNIAIYLIFAVLTYFGLVLLIFETPATFLSDLMQALSGAPPSHSVKLLIEAYIRDGSKIAVYVLLIFSIYGIHRSLANKGLSSFKQILVILPILYFTLYAEVMYSPYHWQWSLFLTSIWIVFLIRQLFHRPEVIDRRLWNLLIVSTVISTFIPAAGSNTGLLKAWSMISVALAILIYARATDRKPMMVLLVMLIPPAFMERLSSTYEDAPPSSLSAQVSDPRLRSIKTTESKVKLLESVNQDVQLLRRAGVTPIFYGAHAHILYYLHGQSESEHFGFQMSMGSEEGLKEMRKSIAGKSPPIVLIDKRRDGKSTAYSNTPMGMMLLENGYREVPRIGYALYLTDPAALPND